MLATDLALKADPVSRYWGPWIPPVQIWQDPISAVDHKLVDAQDIQLLKEEILQSGISSSRLISTAWSAAASFRGTDRRGGANGGRLRLSLQKNWEVNEPEELAKTLARFENIQLEFHKSQKNDKKFQSQI